MRIMISAKISFNVYLIYTLCSLIAVHSSAAFTSPCVKSLHRAFEYPLYNPTRIFMSEDVPLVENEMDTDPPKPAVKCPDCDLCDGSGRYVQTCCKSFMCKALVNCFSKSKEHKSFRRENKPYE